MLSSHGVDTTLVQVVEDVPTSCSIVCVQREGQRPELHARGASDYYDARQFYPFDLVGARPDVRDDVLLCLPYVDYFMPSIEEARTLSNLTDNKDVLQFFLDHGVKTCVFTLGADGAIVADQHTYIHVPAYDVEVVDTTGCGDAFSAGFIAGLIQQKSWEWSARLGRPAWRWWRQGWALTRSW
jgi:sugar/nucleoside kinase (ribokinase family)